MKQRSLFITLAATLLLTSSVPGAVYLQNIYSRGVKTGQTVVTTIDSLNITMRVNSGVAVSNYSLVLTPQGSQYYTSAVDTTFIDGKLVVPPEVTVQPVDSVEMQLSFTLPTDFVADSMWLWIDGKKVPAYIQDRVLASQQYTQIVGYRRDPAILETWGNGSYSLRIFPAESFKSRKIEIEFHHTFDDDALYGAKGLIAAAIPFTFAASSGYVSSAINQVSATFSAEGPGTYSASLPGIGEGTFSSGTTLQIHGVNVVKIDSGAVTTADPSGNDEYLWFGREPKSDVLEAGLTMDLTDDNMRFENEPDTRIVLIDVKDELWDWNKYYTEQAAGYGTTVSYTGYQVYNVWERAQKYAVLALQQYLRAGDKFNVIIGGKTAASAFDAPVEATDENIRKAIALLITSKPTGTNTTLDLLKAAQAQAPDGIVILISDLFQPAQYQVLTTDKTTNASAYVISSAGNKFDEDVAQIDRLISGSKMTLFTINDYYMLSQEALKTGGFNLGGILNRYNIPFAYEVVDGVRIKLPELPKLFGSSNGSGLRHLAFESEQLTDLVYTIDNNYSYVYYGSRTMIEDMAVMAKNQIAISPYYYSSYLRTGRMRLAGHTAYENAGRPVSVTVKGKLDGLWFTKSVTATGTYTAASSSYRPEIDPQWAFRKSEQLAFDNYVANAAAIEAIGRDYHIVTRQTSLLALEPGTDLYVDSAWQAQQVSSDASGAGAAPSSREAGVADQASLTVAGGASYNASGTGIDFDGVSLDNILLKNRMAVAKNTVAGVQRFALTTAGKHLQLTMSPELVGDGVSMRIFDLKGRLVAVHALTQNDFHGGTALWDIGGFHGVVKGVYTVQVTGSTVKKVFRITLVGK